MNDVMDKCVVSRKAKSNYNTIQCVCFIIHEGQRCNGINWPPLAIGTMIAASFALAVGNIEHSTGLVARSLLLKKFY